MFSHRDNLHHLIYFFLYFLISYIIFIDELYFEIYLVFRLGTLTSVSSLVFRDIVWNLSYSSLSFHNFFEFKPFGQIPPIYYYSHRSITKHLLPQFSL
jgi:hypothetical protein